jgi:hypothetical protein
MLETFHANYPNAAGPQVRLAHWIRTAAAGVYDEDHPDDDKAAHGALDAGKWHATCHE